MVVIGLEGTDGTGKSTLAEAIKLELERRFPDDKVELLHRGPPQRPVIEEYATDVEKTTHHLVLDRWHLGELVYPTLYRDGGPYGTLGVAGFRWVEKFLQARGARFWVLDQPYNVVKQRLATRGEDYLQAQHVEQVLERFREVNAMSCLTDWRPFVPRDGVEYAASHARAIVDVAVLGRGHVEALRRFRSYVGPAHPTTLLVGEKRGGRPPFASEACFGPVKNRSGEYLWESLPDPFWRGVGAVNAKEDDVFALWPQLGKPPVVALGREAANVLEAVNVPHGVVPHPQKTKRFHHKLKTEYGQLVAAVAKTQEDALSWPS